MKINNIQCSRGQTNEGLILSNKQIKDLFPKKKNIQIETVSQNDFENLSYGIRKTIEFTIKNYLECESTPLLSIGGDHYTSVATILGSLMIHGPRLRLVYLDAHGDIHNTKTSPSGNMHGMVLRSLIEHSTKGIPRLRPSQILYIGIRDLEKEEWDFIDKKKIQYIPAMAFHENNPTIWRTLSNFIGENPVHVSLDVDVLDPSFMSSTGTRAPNGISITDLEKVLNICKPDFLDIVEYNPTIGTVKQRKTSLQTMKKIISWII